MSSSNVPSGSRKYTLVPRPLAPPRVMGPASMRTPWASRCATASPIEPSHSKQRSLLPGATVHVELLTADSVGDPPVDLHDISAEHVSVEAVRTLEVADRDDDVVQAHARTIRARGETDSRNSRGVERVVRQ